jgi:hypothetical protein
MITKESYQAEWIYAVAEKLGKTEKTACNYLCSSESYIVVELVLQKR